MTKTQSTMNDVIRNSKHGFQHMDDRPGKPQKHRYERRKIRELLRSQDLIEPEEPCGVPFICLATLQN